MKACNLEQMCKCVIVNTQKYAYAHTLSVSIDTCCHTPARLLLIGGIIAMPVCPEERFD